MTFTNTLWHTNKVRGDRTYQSGLLNPVGYSKATVDFSTFVDNDAWTVVNLAEFADIELDDSILANATSATDFAMNSTSTGTCDVVEVGWWGLDEWDMATGLACEPGQQVNSDPDFKYCNGGMGAPYCLDGSLSSPSPMIDQGSLFDPLPGWMSSYYTDDALSPAADNLAPDLGFHRW